MATLTWRDVAAPDATAALYGLHNAGEGIQKAFDGLSAGVDKFAKTQQDMADAAGLASAMRYSDPSKLKDAVASNQIPMAGMSASGIASLNGLVGSKIEQNLHQTQATSAQHDLDQVLNDEDFQKNHASELGEYQSALATGNPERIAAATQNLTSAGMRFGLLQDIGKAGGAMGAQAAAIRSSDASAREAGARIGLIGAQTQEIHDNMGLKRSSALLGSQIAQAQAIDPASGPAVVSDFIKNGGDPRAASPFLSQLTATATRTSSAANPVVSGGKNTPTTSTGSLEVDSKLADALAKVRGNNPDADKSSLQASVNSTDNASDFVPDYAKKLGISIAEFNPAMQRVKALVKDQQGTTINDKTAAELIARNIRDPSAAHPSEWFDRFNDFPSEGGKVFDRAGVLKDAASLVPDSTGVSPAQRAFSLDQKNSAIEATLTGYAQKAAAARNELIRLGRLKAAGLSNPQLDAAMDKNTKLMNAYINALDGYGKSK